MSSSYSENIQVLLQGAFTSSNIDYSFKSPISQGVSSSVHVIKCPQYTCRDDKLLAIKVFKREYLDTVHYEVDVYRKILKDINHDFFVKAYGYKFELEDFALIYLEYIPRGTLYEYIISHQQLKPSTYQLVFTLAEISEALNMLHDIGIVHQDIKSDNILIRDNGHLAICDYGISWINDRPADQFRHSVVGDSIHLAPEVANKCVSFLDYSVDYYSLGVLICEMVDNKRIPDPLNPAYNYNSPTTFEFIPHTIRKTVAALMNPKRYNRLCNDKKGNRSLLLEPGVKSIIWPKFGVYLKVDEVKESIRALLLETPFN